MADRGIPTGAPGVVETRGRVRDGLVEPYVIPVSERILRGVYSASLLSTVQAAADAAGAARWFLYNPLSSTVGVAVREVAFRSHIASILATPTSPRLMLSRFTYAGTPTGALAAPAQRRSTDPAPAAQVRTVSAGWTVTSAADVRAFLPVAAATAVGIAAPGEDTWQLASDAAIVLAAGEGLMLRQPDAGTVADTRRCIFNVSWEEFEL